ncbi:hypothetical protein QJS04_geneDACA001236 [Acorus gramineus]|uniref:Uncharacterized protein n=1 Tax=Acorus gramineus TaxID=55184 RepID=A0AAV9ACJ8_ACOGR|nr:hypothetical protein QJS04_geneDACA001236 [Acorus gramineus]
MESWHVNIRYPCIRGLLEKVVVVRDAWRRLKSCLDTLGSCLDLAPNWTIRPMRGGLKERVNACVITRIVRLNIIFFFPFPQHPLPFSLTHTYTPPPSLRVTSPHFQNPPIRCPFLLIPSSPLSTSVTPSCFSVMMNLVDSLIELMKNMFMLVTKPFLVIKLVCLLGERVLALTTLTSVHLIRIIINVHVQLCFKILAPVISVLSLPVRIVNALQRERFLETRLDEIVGQFESLVWENKELEEQLKVVVKDHNILETVLAEIEDEHDNALIKIELLENELRNAKAENLQLKELKGKSLWGIKAPQDDQSSSSFDDYGVPFEAEKGFPSSNLIIHEIARLNEDKLQHDFLKTGPKSQSIREGLTGDEALVEHRVVALRQSLFSASLSLLVGMIVWEAENPCMPLIVALFIVVGMSLNSVIRFFSVIKNKPASDAVKLLSFNWFILGTLTYPTLPTVAHLLAPHLMRLFDRVIYRLSSPA